MVKIRLMRAGAKKRPFYRVIAIDERRKRDGRALEFLGTYDPVARPSAISLQVERIQEWERRGAQLSDAVRALVRRTRGQAPAAPAAAGTAPASSGDGAVA
jgi:small subunit ribosomal protein S16